MNPIKNKCLPKLALAGVMGISMMSCNSFLDITPDGQEKLETILSTPDGIESAMYGVYSQLRNSNLYGSSLSFRIVDIMGQYFTVYGGNNDHLAALQNYDYTYSSVRNDFEYIWTTMYNNISNVNAVINCKLLSGENLTFPFNIYKGEALGLRAFMHFDLVRLFPEQYTLNPNASGIPYSKSFSLITPDFMSLKENYDNILADLLEAEKLLANEGQYTDMTGYMMDRMIHFNLNAVKATLARVYLTMGDKANAMKYAKEVIDNSGKIITGRYSLYGDLAGVLSSNETIFGVYYSEFYSLVGPNLQQHISWSSLQPRRDCLDIFRADGEDQRVAAYFLEDPNYSVPTFIKLTDQYELNSTTRPADLIPGINLIRLPEMYYIMAESLLDTDPAQATEYFNTMIYNRGLLPLDQRNTPLTLTTEIINNERYKEFWGEGQGFFNHKRLNIPISTPEGDVMPVYIVPIPDIEFEYRPN